MSSSETVIQKLLYRAAVQIEVINSGGRLGRNDVPSTIWWHLCIICYNQEYGLIGIRSPGRRFDCPVLSYRWFDVLPQSKPPKSSATSHRLMEIEFFISLYDGRLGRNSSDSDFVERRFESYGFVSEHVYCIIRSATKKGRGVQMPNLRRIWNARGSKRALIFPKFDNWSLRKTKRCTRYELFAQFKRVICITQRSKRSEDKQWIVFSFVGDVIAEMIIRSIDSRVR